MRPSTSNPFSIWVPLEPRPASRPIVSRYGTRYGKKHMQYQADFVQWIEEIRNETEWSTINKELCSTQLEFVATKARTSKLHTPNFDIDNACKLILDCWTSSGLIWTDDKQVVTLCASKRFATPEEAAGTFFSVWLEEE